MSITREKSDRRKETVYREPRETIDVGRISRAIERSFHDGVLRGESVFSRKLFLEQHP